MNEYPHPVPLSEDRVRQIVSSQLDIQNKLTTCSAQDVTNHLNDDVPLSNLDRPTIIQVRTNYILFRIARNMGMRKACMNHLHENNEILNAMRGLFGFGTKAVRSQFTHSESKYTEDTGGSFFRRSKDETNR